MMNVRTMGRIVDAMEETPGSIPDVVKLAISRWNGDVGTTGYIRSSNNHIFRFEQKGNGCFLRLTPSSERDRCAVEGELEFVLHLAAHDVPVAHPLKSDSGSFIEEIPMDREPLYAAVFKELSGKTVEFETQQAPVLHAWGHALGELHNASQSFAHDAARKLRAWTDDIRSATAWLPHSEEAARRELAEATGWLESLDVRSEDFGAIHFDFEEDNLFWDGTRFHICDFDCAARYWYMADIAFALYGFRNELQSRRHDFSQLFLEGYRTVKDLSDTRENQMSHFVRFCVVYHFAKMCRAYQDAAPNEDPAWLAGMRQRHDSWFEKTRREFELPFEW